MYCCLLSLPPRVGTRYSVRLLTSLDVVAVSQALSLESNPENRLKVNPDIHPFVSIVSNIQNLEL